MIHAVVVRRNLAEHPLHSLARFVDRGGHEERVKIRRYHKKSTAAAAGDVKSFAAAAIVLSHVDNIA
jgi:hypothetical protein